MSSDASAPRRRSAASAPRRRSDASAPRRRSDAPAPSGARGQTLPDFAVGIAVFLVAITFVSVFVPQLIVPFDDQERPVVVERLATDLATEGLVENGSSDALNETATHAFFDRNESDALDRFGVSPWYSLNVTLRDSPGRDPDSAVLCAGGAGDFWITTCDPGGDRFAVGPSVPERDRSVATARRTVFAVNASTDHTKYVILEVQVW